MARRTYRKSNKRGCAMCKPHKAGITPQFKERDRMESKLASEDIHEGRNVKDKKS